MKVTTEASLLGGVVTDSLNPKTILDIGSGTGLLSLMMAQKFPQSAVVAVEVDHASYLQARANVEASPWSDRIQVIHQSIQQYDSPTLFDLIICNPPFYNQSLLSPHSRVNLARHDQTLQQKELASQIERRLSPEGQAYVLYPPFESEAFLEKLETLSPIELIDIYNKPADIGRSVFRQISRLSFRSEEAKKRNIFIRNATGDYSAEFTQLLAAYYLHL